MTITTITLLVFSHDVSKTNLRFGVNSGRELDTTLCHTIGKIEDLIMNVLLMHYLVLEEILYHDVKARPF